MGVNKVDYNTKNGAETLIDLTSDTVTPQTLAEGATAHAADGSLIVGAAKKVNIVQETGTSETDIMSQKAVTEEIEQLSEQIVDLGNEIDNQNERIEDAIENEKGNIAQLIINELQGLPVFGVVDENNTITVTSQLSGGTYTLMYENEDGTLLQVGTITVEGGKVVIVNLLESALTPNDITTVFDGKGYKNGYYASAAEPFYNTDANFFCTGLMVIPTSKTFYVKGCTIDTSLSHTRFGFMKEDGRTINTAILSTLSSIITLTKLGEQYYSIALNTNVKDYENSYYFYFSASGIGDNVIVSHTPIE